MPYRGTNQHTFTREECVAGGKTMTPARAIANAINARVWCDSGCPIYPCHFQPTSKPEFGGRCGLKASKNISQRAVKKYLDIILGGKPGLKAQMEEMLSALALEGKTFKDKAMALKAATEFYKAVYGQDFKIRGELDVEKRDYKFLIEVKKSEQTTTQNVNISAAPVQQTVDQRKEADHDDGAKVEPDREAAPRVPASKGQ